MRLGSSPLGLVRLVVYGTLTVIGIPIQFALLRWAPGWAAAFPRLYHAVCCPVMGLHIETVGRPVTGPSVLFVSNHASYLDIPVLGALLPASFVAKSEVAGWPLFGLLAKLQRTVFVERTARGKASEQRDTLAGRLQAGDQLILFPEGTSSDGNRTLPFKTALFSVAGTRIGDRPVTVQPVSITATHLDGIPLGHTLRSLYAWYGDMELAPHLWRMVRSGRITVRVQFHRPVTVEEFGSRKALADHCWREVASGVERAVRGAAAETAYEDDQPVPALAPAR